MALRTEKSQQIQGFIIKNVGEHPNDIVRLTAEKFALSRVAVSNRVRNLVKEGVLEAVGQTKARHYSLKTLASERKVLQITPNIQEHEVWLTLVKPHLLDCKENLINICAHGFTEMFNNVIDHSESTTVDIILHRDASAVMLVVRDHGVGIFNKIQRALNLSEPQHAILELTKGKITTDKTRHTGEGIFFTSRMFDVFIITSGTLIFTRRREADDWIFESDQAPFKGTEIVMKLFTNSTHTTKDIFDKYRSEFDEFGFSKTIIPLVLLKYEGEQLISRSQAKRLMAHVDKFIEVVLDFKGITTIGQAFADEIFRIYIRDHPAVHIYPVNMSDEVKKMIKRVISEITGHPLSTYLDELK